MSRVSNHPASDFDYVLAHEMAHIFTDEIFGFRRPVWLHEGIAGHVAGQDKIRPLIKFADFKKLHNREEWNKAPNYPQAFSFTAFLIKKFRKSNFLQFLEMLSSKGRGQRDFTAFSKLFATHFQMDFNRTILEWKKGLSAGDNAD